MTKRFNDGSRLVGSEIVSRYLLQRKTLFVIIILYKICLTSNSSFFLNLDVTWQHGLQQLRNGQQLLIFVDVCIISTAFYKFVLRLQVLLSIVWRRHGIKYRKTYVYINNKDCKHLHIYLLFIVYIFFALFILLLHHHHHYVQIKSTITKLQAVVCSDGRFRVMREALHRCDPPCIPYLGMYLTDLSFIEEGTPDFTPDGLLNFSKMRMVRNSSFCFFLFF